MNKDLLRAAREMDWGQVVCNGGPPCFHLEDYGKFCGRAQRWAGHEGSRIFHEYVSLEMLLGRVVTEDRRRKAQ